MRQAVKGGGWHSHSSDPVGDSHGVSRNHRSSEESVSMIDNQRPEQVPSGPSYRASRRNFLRAAGVVAGGIAVGAPMAALAQDATPSTRRNDVNAQNAKDVVIQSMEEIFNEQ